MPRTLHPSWWMLLALTAVLALAGPAAAVETTGQIKVSVLDEAGTPLLGAKVTLASEAMMGSRVVSTNYKGETWVPGLPPGIYTVRIELAEFQTKVVEGVRVTIGGTSPVSVVLRPFQATTEVEIIAARPTLDTESSSVGETMTKEFLEDIPAGRSYQSTVQFAPGVTGGSNPNVQGASSYENAWLLDGINISDPVTGTFSMNFNYDSLEEVQVLTGLYKAEYGQALGGIINIRTESGSNEFRTRTGVTYSNGNLSPRRDAVYEPTGEEIESSEYDTKLESLYLSSAVSGPIVKDRIWVHGSYQYTLTNRSTMGVQAPRRFEGHYLFAKITAMPHVAHRLTLQGFGNPTNIDNTRQSNRVLPEAEARQTQGNNMVHGRWEWFISDSLVLNTQYTHMKEYLEITPVPCTWDGSRDWKQCQEGQPEGYIDLITPGVWGRYDAYSRRNYTYYNFDDRFMDNASTDLTLYLPDFLGTMEWKAGVNVRFLKQDQVRGRPGNYYDVELLENEGDPTSLVNYYWVEYSGALHSVGTGTEVAAFVQDTWKPRDNLTFDLGLRYERAKFDNDIGRTIVNTQLFLPRVSVAWDPFNQKRTKIYGGFGMFGDGGRIAISGFLDKNSSAYKIYLGDYFDRDDNTPSNLNNYDTGQSDYALWPIMAAPRTYEFTAGVDQLVWEQLMVGFVFTAKLFRNIWEDDEINLIWNDSGTATVGSQSGIYDDFFRLRTPTEARRDYLGWTVKLRQNLHRNFQVDASVTYSITKGLTSTYITMALDNPVQYPYEYGYLPTDKPWVVKLAGSYRFPFGLSLGARFQYFSGSRFDRQYLSGKSTGYDLYRTPRGTFDSLEGYSQLDLKVTQRIPMKEAGVLELAIEGSNIFNSRVATSIATSELNQEGEIEAISRQNPFSLEFQLHYRFH